MTLSTDGYCPHCGVARQGWAKFCGSCGKPYEAPLEAPAPTPATTGEPAPTTPQGGFGINPMRNVGMLPSTGYKLLGVWVALLLAGWVWSYVNGDVAGLLVWGFIWFWVVSIPWTIIVLVWSGIRNAQSNLEYERWLRRQRQ